MDGVVTTTLIFRLMVMTVVSYRATGYARHRRYRFEPYLRLFEEQVPYP